MCSSAGRDSITICEGGVTAHQSQAGQHPEKDEAGSLMRYFSPAPSGQVMPELMGAIMILSAYQE